MNLGQIVAGIGKAAPAAVANDQNNQVERQKTQLQAIDIQSRNQLQQRQLQQQLIQDANTQLETTADDLGAALSDKLTKLRAGIPDDAQFQQAALPVLNSSLDLIGQQVGIKNKQLGGNYIATDAIRGRVLAKIGGGTEGFVNPVTAAQGAGKAAGAQATAAQTAGPPKIETQTVTTAGGAVLRGIDTRDGTTAWELPATPLPFNEGSLKAALAARSQGLDASMPGVDPQAVAFVTRMTPQQAQGALSALAGGMVTTLQTGPNGVKLTTGPAGAASQLVTAQDFSEVRAAETQARGFMRQAEILADTVAANPNAVKVDGLVQVADNMANLVSGLFDTAKQVFQVGGKPVGASDFQNQMANQYASQLDGLATGFAAAIGGTTSDAATIKGALTQMAFASASITAGQQGRSVTDQDFKIFLSSLGSSRDPKILVNRVQQTAEEIAAAIGDRAKALGMPPTDFRAEFPRAFRAPAAPMQLPAGLTLDGDDGQGHPVVRNAQGNRFVLTPNAGQ